MKTKDEIFVTLKTVLIEHFELSEATIVPHANLYKDLEIDSIDAVDLLAELRAITGRNIDPQTFKQIRSVEDVVNILHQMLNDPVGASSS
jgi:acyl carrier protein